MNKPMTATEVIRRQNEFYRLQRPTADVLSAYIVGVYFNRIMEILEANNDRAQVGNQE